MVAAGLQPHPDDVPDNGQYFLTFVVPAANGCNLKCPICLIDQREEIRETLLRPHDYVRFVREAADHLPIYAVGIQGYEPLLPDALPYTRPILEAGKNSGVPTTLVTNGVFLSDAIDLLAELTPSKIVISLDAASADIHDRVRGVTGAWAASVKGLRLATKALPLQTRLAVNSVLLPSKRQYLDDMPARLAEMGIDDWIVTPLIRVGRPVGCPISPRTKLLQDLIRLQEAADRARIRLTVDDEFDHLSREADDASRRSLRSLCVRTLPENVELVRLTPNGQCSLGAEILRKMAPDAPRWTPGREHAADFLAMLSNYLVEDQLLTRAPIRPSSSALQANASNDPASRLSGRALIGAQP
jgi:sulfatase maturation enzyme AslB (radical SAM superfamily)